MVENFKYYGTLVLTTLMGPADRGNETHAAYMRRRRDEKRDPSNSTTTSPALTPAGQAELEYMR